MSARSPGHAESLSADLEATLLRCAHSIRQVAARYGLDGDDVDEVVQEVRIRLWKSLASREKIAGIPTSYVYRTATSSALDILRRRRSRPDSGAGDEAAALERVTADSQRSGPEGDLERRELAEAIERGLALVIESRRAVVRMHLAGYKLEEIANLMGWTTAKARNLVYRGLDDLRAALTNMGVGPTDAR